MNLVLDHSQFSGQANFVAKLIPIHREHIFNLADLACRTVQHKRMIARQSGPDVAGIVLFGCLDEVYNDSLLVHFHYLSLLWTTTRSP